MKRPTLGIWIAFSLVVLHFAVAGHSQVSKFYPQQPKWGEALTVTYDPHASRAMLSLSDEVYCVGFLYSAEEGKEIQMRMERFRTLLKCSIDIEEGFSFIQLFFVTPDNCDMFSSLSVPVYRHDGIPARDTYLHMMTWSQQPGKYKELSDRELSLYPDNCKVYRHKWLATRHAEPDSFEQIIWREVADLKGGECIDSVGVLYSLSYGYLLLGREEEARSAVRKMFNDYPSSILTGYALRDYENEGTTQRFDPEGLAEVKRMKWEFVRGNPQGEFCRHESSDLAWQEEFPLETMEEICGQWMKDAPDNPQPYYNLATAYNTHDQEVEEGTELIRHAINLLHKGKLRLHGDVFGTSTESMLPSAYLTMAELQVKKEDYASALGSVRAAQALEKEPGSRCYLVEARIWRMLSRPESEESAYLEAWRSGSEEARDSLEEFYRRRSGGTVGFKEYLEEKSAVIADDKALAPTFECMSLDEQRIDSDSLKGKVVVLNFWHTGCAPCRMEIPVLNRLVKEFDEGDVVFIAMALDDPETTKSFLMKHQFDYEVVPGAGHIASQFAVRAYPTHIIIDRGGRLDMKLTGASEDIDRRLSTVITRLLRI